MTLRLQVSTADEARAVSSLTDIRTLAEREAREITESVSCIRNAGAATVSCVHRLLQ